MLKLEDVTIGSDTELFLIERETGNFKSAVGLIGGKKGSPIDIGKCCGLEEDNVSVEFTLPAVKLLDGVDEFWSNIEFILDTIKKKIPDNLDVECCPSAVFEQEELLSDAAKEFGCDPDFLAWEGGTVREKPNSDTNLRVCGNHWHIGYNDPSPMISIEIVKYLDLFLGLPSVIMDDDTRRRKLYGAAGSFRLKPYGRRKLNTI